MSNFIRHLSIRVPWHDTAWNGKTCKNPNKNIYCNILKKIGEKRRNSLECEELVINEKSTYPPCIEENVSILKPIDIPFTIKYRYSFSKSIGGHFKETEINFEKYSASVIPFRWMMRNNTGQYNSNDIQGLDDNKENILRGKEKYLNISWWQCKDNQKILMDTFYNYIAAESSLCFFYSKNAPFIEDTKGRRIIIGIGRITGLGDIREYDYKKSDNDIDSEGLNRALIWNRTVYHSIREDNSDGFIFPYHELLDYSNRNKSENVDFEKCTLFSDTGMFDNFSYVSEHVYNDQVLDLLYKAINVLDEITKVLEKDYSKVLGKDYSEQKKWIEKQIENVWKIRGLYPSFGEVLKSLGIENAYEIERKIYDESKREETIDYWDYFEEHINDFNIKKSIIKKIEKMSEDNKNFYYLISRMSLSEEDINRLKNISDDKKDIINNPYILYTNYDINIFTIDKAIFVDDNLKSIDKNHGIVFEDYDDENNYMRVTAFIVYIMREQLHNFGHTVLPLEMVLKEVNNISMENKINIDIDDINAIKDEDYFKENIIYIESIDDKGKKKISLQLKYYNTIKKIIEETVNNRINKNNKVDKKSIVSELNDYSIDDKYELSDNQKDAINHLALNKFSVLTGSAGTGKTHVIKALCSLSEINKESIIILTPTGKARTLLQNVNNAKTMTIAGFLSEYGRYNFDNASFSIKEKYEAASYKTVIIDETSMVSETMLAAIFEVVGSNADRIILVGDHCQLPPIEEGKPFYDIIKYLEDNDLNDNLLILRKNYRQNRQNKSLEFISKFRKKLKREIIDESDIEITEQDDNEEIDNNLNKEDDIEFIEWNEEEELEEKILEVLSKISINDYNSLLKSFGALENGNYVTFKDSEIIHNSWQILTPFRERNYVGCKPINNVIHNNFFENELNKKYKDNGRRLQLLPTPRGEEQILYGDKVINLKNHCRDTYGYNKENKFIANGDIGIITGRIDTTKSKENDFFIINFESANGFFKFDNKDFPKDENSIIELAYALTVHKAQGSGFGITIVIIPNISSNLVSREMIYTALTRHKNKVYVLHQNLREELNKYQEDRYSMIIRRMNNLFTDNPLFEYYEKYNTYFDKNKIHITSNGEFVRSKSEVIIADNLCKSGIYYEYEKELKLGNRRFIPDFTIEKDGKVYIWEHLGMMDDKAYKAKWEDKKSVYYSNGIKDAYSSENAKYYLITTEESSTSGINSKAISDIINKYLK